MFASILLKHTHAHTHTYTHARAHTHTQRHLGFCKTRSFFSILCGSSFHFFQCQCLVLLFFLERFTIASMFLCVSRRAFASESLCLCINLCQLQASNTNFVVFCILFFSVCLVVCCAFQESIWFVNLLTEHDKNLMLLLNLDC